MCSGRERGRERRKELGEERERREVYFKDWAVTVVKADKNEASKTSRLNAPTVQDALGQNLSSAPQTLGCLEATEPCWGRWQATDCDLCQ